MTVFKESDTIKYEAEPQHLDDRAKDAEHLRDSAERAAAEVEAKGGPDDDLAAVRAAHEHDFEELFGDASPKSVTEKFLAYHDRLRSDPTAAHAIREEYERFRFESPRPKQKYVSPYQEGSISYDLDMASQQSRRNDEWREAQKLFSERVTDRKFSDGVRTFLDFHRRAKDDPAYVTGALYRKAEANQLVEREAAANQRISDLVNADDEFAPLRGRLDDVDMLCRSGAIRPVGDMRANLRAAMQALQNYDRDKAIAAQQKPKPKPQPQLTLQQQLEQRLAAHDRQGRRRA